MDGSTNNGGELQSTYHDSAIRRKTSVEYPLNDEILSGVAYPPVVSITTVTHCDINWWLQLTLDY